MSWRTALSRGALFLFVIALFAYTVAVRQPWFGQSSDKRHFWLTAHTLTVLQNWHQEGALAERFAMLDHPRSVEFRSIADRSPYVSYPVGCLLPLYAVSALVGEPPSLRLIMGFNLFNHLAVALLLSALAFAMARASAAPPSIAALYGAIPAAIALLSPGPMYWMQNVYFADQAVILPFVAALCLEWARDGEEPRRRRVASAAQVIVLFWGSFTDYLFVFVALTIFTKRWLNGEYALRPRDRLDAAVRFWLPVVAALGLFAVHVALLDGFGQLFERAVARTWEPGASPKASGWLHMWVRYAKHQYGAIGILSLALGIAGCAALAVEGVRQRWRRNDGASRTSAGAGVSRLWRLLGAAAVGTVPCLAQIYVLRNHSAVHDFSVLKLMVPIALVPWVIFPLALAARLGWSSAASNHVDPVETPSSVGALGRARTVAAIAALLAATSVVRVHRRFSEQFPALDVSGGHAAAFLRQHTGYPDIVFSPDWSIDKRPPQLLSMARKRVYRVDDPASFYAQARAITDTIDEPYRVDLLFTADPRPEWEPVVEGVAPIRGGDVRLYRNVPAPLRTMSSAEWQANRPDPLD